MSDLPLFAAGVKIFYALLNLLQITELTVILGGHLAYGQARNAVPILSAVDYIGIAAGYLCLAQQTVRGSQSQRHLVRAVYGMAGFSGLLATVAVIGVLCHVWTVSVGGN